MALEKFLLWMEAITHHNELCLCIYCTYIIFTRTGSVRNVRNDVYIYIYIYIYMHTKEATNDNLSYHKLCQHCSVTVQKLNYIAIVNTCME